MSENESETLQAGNSPYVLIVGLHGKEEVHIIQGILNDSQPSSDVSNDLEIYKWFIDNKYYTAEINLCKVKNVANIELTSSILKSVEALIIYIDSCKESALKDVDDFLMKLDSTLLDVKLLVCDSFTNHSKTLAKDKAQKWCIDNSWELVELNIEASDSDHDDDLEDDFVDSFGFTRIRQALNAHTWSNLRLKDEKDIGNFGHLFNQLTLQDSKFEPEVPYQMLNDGSTVATSNPENIDDDDFYPLFSTLSEMKEKADSLPLNERRNYAEKVAMAFLKAFGDDESDCLDSEDDNT